MSLIEAIMKAKLDQQRLSDATDQLNVVLKQAEAAIRELKLGVSTKVCFPDGEAWLKFGRYGKDWRLVVEFEEDETPVINASRALRLQAVQLLQPLVVALCKGVDDEIVRVEAASAKAAAFVAGLAPEAK